MFKGKLSSCIVCGAMIAIHGEKCSKCNKPDDNRCWKHHNQVCPQQFKHYLQRRYGVKEFSHDRN